MNYLVADVVIRIKNAYLAKRQETLLPYSKMSKSIADILVKERFLTSVKEETADGRKVLKVTLRYERRVPILTDAQVVSKPSLRVYANKKTMPTLQKKRLGLSVLSTNQGVMTEEEARKRGIGGEILFKIW